MESNVAENGQSSSVVAGVFLEKTKEALTIYQAMKRRLLKPGTCLALLEAQAATVGIVDAINNKKFSVEEAVNNGIVGPEMKEKLLFAEKALVGYTDPYTNEAISVFQAIQKNVIPCDVGARLLEAQAATTGIYDPAEKTYISEESASKKGYYDKDLLDSQTEALKVFNDPISQEQLNYKQLLKKCTVDTGTGLHLLPICITFKGLRRAVSSAELLASKIIDKDTYDNLQKGKTTTQDVMLMETVKEYLEGKGSIAGLALMSSGKRMSIYQAMKEGILMPGTALILLEAQAATGFLIDPVKNKKYSVDDAVRGGIVGPEYHAKLLSAERAVTGYKDPYTGDTISLFQALSKELIIKEHGIRLLEAQIATGGLIDPVNSHRLPVDVAYERGLFDQEMNAILEDPGDDTKGFFDPNTKENLTYLQLMERSVIDPATGLCLLPIKSKSGDFNYTFIKYENKITFKEVMVTVNYGKYMGMKTSLWELMMSEYLSEKQRRDIIQQYRERKLTIEVVITKVLEIIEHSVKSAKITFEGIRETVTAEQLVEADIITKNDFEQLSKGKKTTTDIIQEEDVKTYLQGKSSIAGILLPDSQIMSIYQAQIKGKLRPGTSLILLEAQASTGFVIDPVSNKKFSVKGAVENKVVGPELQAKLLSAERAVTGYKNPHDGKTISLFQAMQKDLIVKDHGIRLLEAQIATGGIIDPINSHRIPVHVAYKRGYFNVEMNQILSDPTDDTKGFFDPNTQENLTYLDLMDRCVIDINTGLCLLPLKGKDHRVNIQEDTKETFKGTYVSVKYGRFKNKQVTLWELLNSEYLSEEKRQDLLKLYKSREITVEKIITLIVEIIKTKEGRKEPSWHFTTLRSTISVSALRDAGVLGDETYEALIEGRLTQEDILQTGTVAKYLRGTSSIAGVILQPSNQKIGIYEAKKKGLLTPGTALCLLEAQAATGYIIDPVKNEKLTVDQATKQQVIGPELYEKLLSAEQAVTGYTDPYSGKKISLFQAIQKDLILKQHGIRLLEAQIVTGGIIDPINCIHLPIEVAYKRGYFDADMNKILTDPTDDTKGFFDPNTHKNMTYLELLQQCTTDPQTGFLLLPLKKKGDVEEQTHKVKSTEKMKRDFEKHLVNISIGQYSGKCISLWELLHTEYFNDYERKQILEKYGKSSITIQQIVTQVTTTIETTERSNTKLLTDEEIEKVFKGKSIHLKAGKLAGKQVTVWELVHSEYISAEKRSQLILDLKERRLTIEEIVVLVTAIVEEETSKKHKFKGLRKQVSASQLFESKIISKDVLGQIITGEITDEELIEMDSIKKYLTVTNSIAGVRIESTKQIMSIYEAKTKGLLTPGTSLVLLEAQAATGFVIDPVSNRKLSVEDAVTEGVVGAEWKAKLLSAERAVTGYNDPYTGGTISLFQALKKDLIVKDHGIRLLEAQIATGGIIDPVHSHRVPTEAAYQRGYFDEEMNQILLNPGDDTKGFFDPNTKENLTYLQLIERCVIDPSTGLSLLAIVKKGEFYFFIDENTKTILKSTMTKKAKGKFRGQEVCLWELLYSMYITEEKRRDLVQQYKKGAITIEYFMEQVLIIIQKKTSSTKIEQKEEKSTSKNTKTTTITTTTTETTFHGIRKDVTAKELLQSKIIDKNLYDDLSAGKVTVDHVSEMDSVRRYLQGTNSIAGVYVQSTKETLSISEAKTKGLLTPGTSLVLLEAQAATGFIIDPVNNRKLSVEEAAAAGVIGLEWKSKLLSAERAVTGYKDPYTEDTISLFQALKKDLIVKDHGIRLLEAQIATGGIIDPVYSHRVPVEVAYQRGYFDEEMNQILLDPDDDTKGFFDPNTKENLTYLQLVERCVKDPVTGLSLLVIVKKGEFYFFVDECTKTILKSSTTTKAGGKFSGQTISLWELLYSMYITEEKRRDLVQQYKNGAITIEYFMEQVLIIILKKTSSTKIEQKEEKSTSKNTKTTITTTTTETSFHGIRKDVTAKDLLQSKIIDKNLYDDLSAGKVTVDHVSQMDSVRRYLQGTNSIAGVYVQSTKETLSISEAKTKGLLTPGTSLVLLEAQAATGFIIDPVNNRKLSVEEAAAAGVIGLEWKSKLLSAERAVTGYKDPYTEDTISLFQALKKDLIVKDHGIRLLEAQIATGGIIDPVYSHRVPVEVAYQRGYFDEEMNQILLDPDDDTKGFFDPNTKENLTYLQLVERCVKDPVTGLSLLVIVKKGEFYFFVDECTKTNLKSSTTTKAGGKFSGQTISLWELLYSMYITEEKRRDLVQQYKNGAITIECFMEQVLIIIQKKTSSTKIEQKEEKSTSKNTKTTITTTTTETSFHGIRKDVTAKELLQSKIIDKDLYDDLSAGKVTVDHVSEMDSVRRYLQGTNSIAGVYVQSTKETLSISEAKTKGLLTPGTSLVLLEAQAATGFIIDPVNNRKLSVEEAAAAGVIGLEWKSKLLSAERAVTGYKDPYTEDTISLFQALKKDLIVKDHGIRLLEAQIATGGIIDPVYSHRVPVEVAYQRGYFDEEMNQILLDPDDDTKGFFDPNTKENLTYLQLVERCVKDPVTGLSLLVIVKKGEFYFFVDECTKTILKSSTTTKAGGKFSGQTISLWELLYSMYITEEKRRDLVQQYKNGAITIEYFMEQVLIIILKKTSSTKIEQKEEKSTSKNTKTTITTTTTETSFHGIRKDVTAKDLLQSKIIDKNLYDDLSAGKVTVDHVSQMDSVRRYLQGTNSIAGVYVQSTKETLSISEAKTKGLLTPGTSLVLLEAQAATGFIIDPVNNRKLSVEEAAAAGVIGLEWKSKLLSAERAVTGYKDPYTEDTISLFQALKKDLIVKDHGIRLLEAQIATGGIIDPVYSHRVPVEVAYQRGYFDEEMNQILLDPDDDTKGFFDPNTKENLTYLQLVERCVKDPVTGLSLLVIVKKGEFYFFVDECTKTNLKSSTTTKAGGKFSGQTISLWELLYSMYITEEKRRDLVQQYKNGAITIECFMEQVLIIIQKKTSSTTIEQKEDKSTSQSTKTTTITTTTVETTFHGIRKDVTAKELLQSKIIDKGLYDDLSAGKVTVEQVSQMDSVRRYLQGTNSIAGVYVQSTKETLSISEAKTKGLLTPGTSLVLLEAQAATGFIIDPVNNRKLSVEEAAAAGVIGLEWKSKLLSAERAVTGYKDPYTGDTISLFQALKKDLIVKDHGIRLLEAQIATGGIIDPVYSHRVPVEVAYQRGYFDEEMNQILLDPDDDTKGFFDPNTKENLTYLQLVERCVKDPVTGLSLLNLKK
ncbi:epiplakin [Sardina pilchardus]|uniref:epiplakin n=1 Tax=Sardina pilchardus TaxID=27697 RepID=UPI002E1385A0